MSVWRGWGVHSTEALLSPLHRKGLTCQHRVKLGCICSVRDRLLSRRCGGTGREDPPAALFSITVSAHGLFPRVWQPACGRGTFTFLWGAVRRKDGWKDGTWIPLSSRHWIAMRLPVHSDERDPFSVLNFRSRCVYCTAIYRRWSDASRRK